MTRSGLREWESTQRQTAHGAVESEQRVRLVRPVINDSVDGAQRLGSAYWQQVERFTFGLVRARQGIDGVELRLLGRRPLLLAFAQPGHTVFGSDWPFAPQAAVHQFTDGLDHYTGINQAQRQAIDRDNAAALFSR